MRHVAISAFFALALAVCADDLDDRLRAAVARMESEDAAERDAGEADLVKLAPVAPEKVKELLEHADPEVRARVERVCRKTGLVKVDENTRRREEIFREMARPTKTPRVREEAIRELLELGPGTAAMVARELREGKYVEVPEPVRVVAPGSPGVTLRIRNPGPFGCWFRPERNIVSPRLSPFGLRPGNEVSWSGAVGGLLVFLQTGASLEDQAVEYLACLVRIPPGGTADFGTSGRMPGRCGVLDLTGTRMGYHIKRAMAAEFQGVGVAFPEADPPGMPDARRIVLGRTESDHLAAVAVREDDGWALEVTALDDRPAPEHREAYDNFWWAALGEDDAWLGSGAMESTKEKRAALKKGELRRVPLRAALPEGTRRLWLGYDENFKDVQAVADPVTLEEKKK